MPGRIFFLLGFLVSGKLPFSSLSEDAQTLSVAFAFASSMVILHHNSIGNRSLDQCSRNSGTTWVNGATVISALGNLRIGSRSSSSRKLSRSVMNRFWLSPRPPHLVLNLAGLQVTSKTTEIPSIFARETSDVLSFG